MLARTIVDAAALVAVLPGAWQCTRTSGIRAAAHAAKVAPVTRGPRTSTVENADGSTPLQWAVYDGDVAEVSASAACRRRRVARQQLRRHADEPRRRSRQHRDAEAAARSRRECRLAQSRWTDRADGGRENRQRGSRTAAAEARRHGRCAREVGRTDRADVGVGAPASGDDAAADRQGRRRQRALDRSRLPASCDGRGASQEPGQRRLHAAAVCRARELSARASRCCSRTRSDIDLPDPDGVSPLLAGDHERQLGPRASS